MKVICITGKAGAGKDLFASAMKEALEVGERRVLITHYADLVKYVCREFCGWDGNKDERGRSLLQKVGTDIFRRKDPEYWVNFLMDMLEAFSEDWDYVLIPDCRFPNEYLGPIQRGFHTELIRITRPGMESKLTENQKRHASECSMDGIKADIEIENIGTKDDFETTAWLTAVQIL